MQNTPLLRIPIPPDEEARRELLIHREWLVTNGIGGYASGTLGGVLTRRYHGVLVAALPTPLGRTVLLNHLSEELELPDGSRLGFGGRDRVGSGAELEGAQGLAEFRLECGLPVWRYEVGGMVLERRILMPHGQNTVHVTLRLVSGKGTIRLRWRPAIHFRSYEAPLSRPLGEYRLSVAEERYELRGQNDALPPLRIRLHGEDARFTTEERRIGEVLFAVEESRGYDARGELWSPGHFDANLSAGSDVTLVASAESWEIIEALDPERAAEAERERRERLLTLAPAPARSGVAAQLVLAADQFIVTPAGRPAELARTRALGDEARTVIAGYHWFTDWGRDTMISLEGLTLCTGREREAGSILRTFARYVRDGLIPNLFPDGSGDGLYHTADATLWFFHALDRYLQATNDRDALRKLLPVLRGIADHHLRGTRFGIRVDPADGLLRQGVPGYQLTWMDAKVDDWVVTPRRGKAVEINALWYNALRLLARWLREEEGEDAAAPFEEHAARARKSFNERFWYAEGGHLYDVVDGEEGDSTDCRSNQIFAISLPHAVLERERWEPVIETVRERLLTPVGLRSLAPGHLDYKPRYFGNLRARDAAYHQGTVWGWLIGPWIDAWLKLHPNDLAGAREFLHGFEEQLDEFGVGSLAEIYDAEPPFTPRGCIAQAWSIAEVLRCWIRTDVTEPA